MLMFSQGDFVALPTARKEREAENSLVSLLAYLFKSVAENIGRF